MAEITAVYGREVLDSRGNPTVEVEVHCGAAGRGRAIAPSGASTGKHEAVELRDGDPARYGGRGVLHAIANVHGEIAPAVIGFDASEQTAIDHRLIELDGTANKSRIGANATLAVSLACAHAAANTASEPLFAHLARLWEKVNSKTAAHDRSGSAHQATSAGDSMLVPVPMVNMISGGLHAGGNLDFQDFLIVPVGATSYSQALQWIVRVYRALASVLASRGHESVLVGDEGGFGPKLPSNRDAIERVVEAIESAGLNPGTELSIAIDVASSHFYGDGRYCLTGNLPQGCSAEQLIDELADWAMRYPIISIEDGCAEDDWPGWRLLSERLGDRLQLVGDDLFVTNLERLERGIKERIANAVLVKPNQVGTLTETLEVMARAHSAGYRTVVSARSGETEDTTIAHLAVATGAGQIKIGSVARTERLAKYNELLRIEQQLGSRARFVGNILRAPA